MPSLIATLGLNLSQFNQGLESAQNRARASGEGIGSALGGELNSKLAGLVSVAAIEETIRRTVEYGSKVNDLALRLGISTDAVQQWDFALKQNGSSIESAVGFFEKLAIARDKALAGSDKEINNFQKLGITLDQLKNTRTEDIATSIARAFEAGDPQALIGPLREVGGRSAGELVTAFRDGLADALREAPLISPADIAALDRAGDAWAKLKAEFTSSAAAQVANLTEAALGLIDFARLALAVPVGALIGVVEEIKKSKGDVGIAGTLIKGVTNPFGIIPSMVKGAAEALDAVDQQQLDRDQASEERKARLSQLKVSAFEEEDDKNAKREADKAAREKERADREAERERERQDREVARSAERARKDAEDKMPFKPGSLQVNSLQRSGFVVGALGASPELAMLETQKKSENHLMTIKKDIARLVAISSDSSSEDDVQF